MGRLAVITEGATGIGFGLARMCAQGGYDLHLVGVDKEELISAKKMLQDEFDCKIYVQTIDLTKPDVAQQIYRSTVLHKTEIEVLINAAGFGDYGLFIESNWKRLEQMLQLNVRTLTQLSHLYAKHFSRQHSGKIMNIASTAAFLPGPNMAVYHASKAYVLNFTEALAEELRDAGVSVTALCPGPTKANVSKYTQMRGKILMEHNLPEVHEVAEFGYRAMMDGKRVAIHGLGNKLVTEIPRFAPRKAVSFVANYIYGKREG
jgi:short-subunit dehydrogenase